MVSMTDVKCMCCGKLFQARTVDIKRGWGKFCSKSCKAKEQEKRTGQHKDYINGKPSQFTKKKNKSKRNVFDLSSAIDRKIHQMDNPIIVEPCDPWDYDGPHSC